MMMKKYLVICLYMGLIIGTVGCKEREVTEVVPEPIPQTQPHSSNSDEFIMGPYKVKIVAIEKESTEENVELCYSMVLDITYNENQYLQMIFLYVEDDAGVIQVLDQNLERVEGDLMVLAIEAVERKKK